MNSPRGVIPKVVRSEHTRSPAHGPFARITVDETLLTPLAGDKQLDVTTRVWLAALEGEPGKALTAQELAAAEQSLAELSVFSPPTPREGVFDAERIAQATLDGLLGEIEQLQTKPDADTPDTTSAYLQRFSLIAAMLRQRTADVAHAAELIRKGHAQAQTLVQALGSAGSEQAQALLRELAADDTVSAKLRSRAAKSLIRVQQPDQPTIERLKQWAAEPGMEEHGLYGLGTAARHLRERGQVKQATEIADFLGDELDKAHGPETGARVQRILRGIANSADARLFKQVRARAADGDAGVRTAVIDALRFMEHPRVDALLLERARVEEDIAAVRALLAALSAREPSAELAQAVAELTTSRHRYGVRVAAVEQAGQWMKDRTELRALLEQVSRSDEREEVRVKALGMLKPKGKDT